MRFEPIEGVHLQLGESPVWDDRRNLIFLCDITAGQILAIRLGEGLVQQWSFGENVCSLGLCESGRLVVSLTRQVVCFDPETGLSEPLTQLDESVETNRFNDGKVGPDGAFWVGTTDQRTERQAVCSLYRMGPDGRLEQKKAGIKTSNGLAWSLDGRTMYHSDSGAPWLDRHDFDPATGHIGEALRIAAPGEADGRPDGGATDAEGFYWSAGVSAGCLNRFASDGTLVAKYPVAVAAPTMPCFCGSDMKTLLVTSHRYLSPERLAASPLSGGVLAAASQVAGTPIARMKGL